jgi:HEAT repeat protein
MLSIFSRATMAFVLGLVLNGCSLNFVALPGHETPDPILLRTPPFARGDIRTESDIMPPLPKVFQDPDADPAPALPALDYDDAGVDICLVCQITQIVRQVPAANFTSLDYFERDWAEEFATVAKQQNWDRDTLQAKVRSCVMNPRFLLLVTAYGRPDPSEARIIVPVISRMLHDELSGTRALAACGLAAFGPAAVDAVPELTPLLHDKNSVVRLHAARALCQIQGRTDVGLPVLVNALQSDQPDVPDLAALLLGRLGPSAAPAVPALCKAVHAKNKYVRAHAMFALGKIGPAAGAAVPELCEALRNPDNRCSVRVTTVRRQRDSTSINCARRSAASYAAVALGEIGQDAGAALPALAEISKDKSFDDDARVAAREAMRRIRP